MNGRYLRCLAAATAFAFCPSVAEMPVQASSISSVDARSDTITIWFDDVVEGASVFSLREPYRIGVDIKGAKAGTVGRATGIVKKIRQGQYDPNTARIMFDLDRPALVTSGVFSANGRRLMLQIKPVEPSSINLGRIDFLPPAHTRSEMPKSNVREKGMPDRRQ